MLLTNSDSTSGVFSKNTVVDMLKNNVITVTFTKTDGTERVMKCTLLGEYVPPSINSAKTLLQENRGGDNNISVWDIDAEGWRSFRLNSVKNISIG